MAKKYAPNNLDQRQEQIRKAKGNPNKNVHQKKNGSNYKGYTAVQKEAEEAKKVPKQNKLPTWVIIVMAVIFAVLVAIFVLMSTAFKDNLIFGQISMILIGLSCGVLFSMRKHTKRADSTFQNALYAVLAVMAVIMTIMGAYGLVQLL